MFDRRVEDEVLAYCLDKGLGFVSFGNLGFGLLNGATTPGWEFRKYDWHARGCAIGLPLFQSVTLELEAIALGVGLAVQRAT